MPWQWQLVLWMAAVAAVSVAMARQGRQWFGWAIAWAVTGPWGFLTWLLTQRRFRRPAVPIGARRAVLVALGGAATCAAGQIVGFWITTFVFQIVYAPGQSMWPALSLNDQVVVNKMAYVESRPGRGDVVLLRYPLDPAKTFIERVIADEGDSVRIEGGRVSVNNVPRADKEVAPDARSFDDWGPQVVPQGYCFVMGDRRNNSSDSRHWGFVPRRYVLGRVAFRLLAHDAFSVVR